MNPRMERRPAVYGLKAGDEFGYVGSTTVNIRTRLWEHRSRARSGHTAPVYRWMRLVGIENVEIVELAAGDDLRALEVECLVRLRADGHVLYNQSGVDGREHSMSVRTRRLLGASRRGKPTWIKGKRGVEAGWTEERRRAQSERRRAAVSGPREPHLPLPAHGLRPRYDLGCRCEKCVGVVERIAARAQNAAVRTHGTVAAYKHGKCRCDDCRTAYRVYQRRFTAA